MNRKVACLSVAVLVAVGLAGCFSSQGQTSSVREITMWVQDRNQEVHPNVTVDTWSFCATGDGVEHVRGQVCSVPGPTIRVQEGDEIHLKFVNNHTVPHTVHFHGWHPFEVDMNGAELIDGAMRVEPGETAWINWTAEPAGTFIYHCHFQTPTHMDKGMAGAFIVEDPAQPVVAHEEFVGVLDEWSVHNGTEFNGAEPFYNYFTINGKSFPLTEPWVVDPGDRVRIHLVDAGVRWHAMHLHGYTPRAWEGIAGRDHGKPIDVKTVAPGQSVVMELDATREGVWLFHDHSLSAVTAGASGDGWGAYPRGMLTLLVVGDTYEDRVQEIAPQLIDEARQDSKPGGPAHDHGDDGTTVAMQDLEFEPQTLHVEVNTTVTWVNRDGVEHTVTPDDAGRWGTNGSGSDQEDWMESGETWSHTFSEPGTYTYHCIPHSSQDDDGTWQGMVGTVVVEGRP